MPRTMQECHELGHHKTYPRKRCPLCKTQEVPPARCSQDECNKIASHFTQRTEVGKGPVYTCYCDEHLP